VKKVLLDCAEVESEEAFWETYVVTVKPEGSRYFGRNLDAFWDAVSAGGPGWPGECELHFLNTEGLKKLRNGYFYQALKKISQESESVKITIE
jgi:RNAse (barnase) inhibitor barstar